jgi:hypothetical protein
LISDQQQGGVDAARRLQFAGGVLAMAINGGGLDAEASRDLFGIQVGVDEAQAFALAIGQSVCTARHPSPPGSLRTLTT